MNKTQIRLFETLTARLQQIAIPRFNGWGYISYWVAKPGHTLECKEIQRTLKALRTQWVEQE